MAYASHLSTTSDIRQHALSILTDSVIDSHGKSMSQKEVFELLKFCFDVARKRINNLIEWDEMEFQINAVTAELDLCYGLLFKPFLHYLHVQNLSVNEDDFESLWFSLLHSVKLLLGDDPTIHEESLSSSHDPHVLKKVRRSKLLSSAKEGVSERLQNAIMVMIGYDLLQRFDQESNSLSSRTWDFVSGMKFCSSRIDEWVLLENTGHLPEDHNDGDNVLKRVAQ